MRFRCILALVHCALVAVQANAAETRYLYDGAGNLLLETGPASAAPVVTYLTQDALGSTRLVTDATGAQKECFIRRKLSGNPMWVRSYQQVRRWRCCGLPLPI